MYIYTVCVVYLFSTIIFQPVVRNRYERIGLRYLLGPSLSYISSILSSLVIHHQNVIQRGQWSPGARRHGGECKM